MFTRTQTTTGIVTLGFVLLTYIYQQTPANHSQTPYSKEFTELRQEVEDLKLKVGYLERRLSFSLVPRAIFSSLRAIPSHLSIYLSSFLIYTLFLYLFHLCFLNPRTSQTIKFLHIINLIAYAFLSNFYTLFKHIHSSNLAWLIFIFLYSIMSCPMFLYGLTAGSIIPLTIVHFIRPESLTNLFELLSSPLTIAFQWSDDVAKRFNLSLDLLTSNSSATKMYTCFTIEYWYTLFSWLIYLCLFCSIILFLLNQRWKSTTLNSEEFVPDENSLDCLFYYFCVVICALTSIFCRIVIEHYLLGYLKAFTIVFLVWFILSFGLIWLWNR